jgi:hypothetical protein
MLRQRCLKRVGNRPSMLPAQGSRDIGNGLINRERHERVEKTLRLAIEPRLSLGSMLMTVRITLERIA